MQITRTVYLALGLVALSCSSDSRAPVVPDASPPAVALDAMEGNPTFAISLTPSVVTAGSNTQLNVALTNFELVNPQASPPVQPKEGHYHVYVNGSPNPIALWVLSEEIETAQEDTGTLEFRAVLVNSAHQEIVPKVESFATLTVEAP